MSILKLNKEKFDLYLEAGIIAKKGKKYFTKIGDEVIKPEVKEEKVEEELPAEKVE